MPQKIDNSLSKEEKSIITELQEELKVITQKKLELEPDQKDMIVAEELIIEDIIQQYPKLLSQRFKGGTLKVHPIELDDPNIKPRVSRLNTLSKKELQ